jgi:hypothetical protein
MVVSPDGLDSTALFFVSWTPRNQDTDCESLRTQVSFVRCLISSTVKESRISQARRRLVIWIADDTEFSEGQNIHGFQSFL